MHEATKAVLLRLLRVPAEPKPPDGSPESIRVFRAGRNYYRWRLLQWGLMQLVLAAPLVGLRFVPGPRGNAPPIVLTVWRMMIAGAAGGYALLIPVTYCKQRLDYEMRWYIVTDRSLRVRAGIWDVHELTMTFANIQDIRISAGPLQRALGLADVKVTSAGGGGGSEQLGSAHIAEFAGVDCAEAIRDLIVDRLRQYRDAGLGDPDERHRLEDAPADSDAFAAAVRVLEEARRLRAVVE
jgi:membrane protein YdbS with pleckstrin-like domain